jgi:hypothetical protein
MFKGFLLIFNWLSQELSSLLNEDDVMAIPITWFKEYCESPDYHMDSEAGIAPKRVASTHFAGAMIPKAFCNSVKREA